MTRLNGASSLLDRKAVRAMLGVSNSTLQRYIHAGHLTVVSYVDLGFGKPSPRFDPRSVQAFVERRQQIGGAVAPISAELHPVAHVTPPTSAPATPSPTPALAVAVKTLHTSQVVILDALQQPSSFAIEAELWHSLLSLVRSQERLMSEVLLGTPLPLEQQEETRP
jgi:hypothetical protein